MKYTRILKQINFGLQLCKLLQTNFWFCGPDPLRSCLVSSQTIVKNDRQVKDASDSILAHCSRAA